MTNTIILAIILATPRIPTRNGVIKQAITIDLHKMYFILDVNRIQSGCWEKEKLLLTVYF